MILFTDGSCMENPGPGAWAVFGFNDVKLCGGESETTNSRMEIIAILKALEFLDGYLSIHSNTSHTIFSDSQVSVNALNGAYKPKKNLDLIYPALEVFHRLRNHVSVQWIRAHGADNNEQLAKGNAMADSLAFQEARHQQFLLNIPKEP